MKQVTLLMVGGFLGAGKTTLLWESARRLIASGLKVGLITNDQAPDLVDTGLLRNAGFDVREVAGSCFCCDFNSLLNAAENLRGEMDADVLITEPVGSCTDLSATLLQPLKDRYRQEFRLSPLSVVADPARLRPNLLGQNDGLHPSASYIFRKQLEESDAVIISKCDLLAPEALEELRALVRRHLPGREVYPISALNGQGVDAWLSAMQEGGPAGQRVVDVDYDIYAEGEAVLGWLNAAFRLRRSGANLHWRRYCGDLLETLQKRFREAEAPVGHVKLLLTQPGTHIVANLTDLRGNVALRGEGDESRGEAELILNARVQISPDELRSIVHETLASLEKDRIACEQIEENCLSPARPVPTMRYSRVV